MLSNILDTIEWIHKELPEVEQVILSSFEGSLVLRVEFRGRKQEICRYDYVFGQLELARVNNTLLLNNFCKLAKEQIEMLSS